MRMKSGRAWSAKPDIEQVPLNHGQPQRSDAGIEQALAQSCHKRPAGTSHGCIGGATGGCSGGHCRLFLRVLLHVEDRWRATACRLRLGSASAGSDWGEVWPEGVPDASITFTQRPNYGTGS